MSKFRQQIRRRRARMLRSCTGKVVYTKEQAEEIAATRTEDTYSIYNAYRCRRGCKLLDGSIGWHIGHLSRHFHR